MGVIRKLTFSQCEDESTFDLDNLVNNERNVQLTPENFPPLPIHDPQIEEDNILVQEIQVQELVRQTRNRSRRCREQTKTGVKPEPAFRGLGCRGKSYKKYRRYENANLMGHNNLFGHDNEDYLDEITIHDFIPSTISAFTQLMREKENMQIWNDFINMSEEAQEILLEKIDRQEEDKMNQGKKKNTRTKGCNPENSVDLDSNSFDACEIKSEKSLNKEDKRKKHPAFSAQQCFARIDNYLKTLLKKKHIPLTLLESIEKEIVDFFSSAPVSTYKSCLPSGFARLLLHACCQYMDLKCKSYDDADGQRWSHVQNPREKFIPPLINLTNYLCTYCKNFK